MSYFFQGGEREPGIFTATRTQHPAPGSAEEKQLFKKLQQDFQTQFRDVFPDKLAPRTVVIVPSLTLDHEILGKIQGINYYEERLLCLLMLLRMPRTNVIYVTSTLVDPVIIDYYLHLLPGITGYHARQRLTMLNCADISGRSLTEKILQRSLLVERIKNCIPPGHPAHLACFNVTPMERTLAVQLGIPVYGSDPDLLFLGTKSGSRMLFKKTGVNCPPGFENLSTENDIIDALYRLKFELPGLARAVVKINDGFSGEGNAIFYYAGAPEGDSLREWIRENIRQLKIVAPDLNYRSFLKKFYRMQGIVEAFLEGETKTSPSVQCRINPVGEIDIISTHDQLLGSDAAQVFLGAYFPASADYAVEIAAMARKVAEEMRAQGVLGRFSIDFVSVRQGDGWKHYAVEVNLRKGGTTHPYLMLQFLTGGKYNSDTGDFELADGKKRFYFASDNFFSENCKGLTPHDLIDIAICNDIHFNSTKEEGVVFHIIGALSQYGKLGLVCIGETIEKAMAYYRRTVDLLEHLEWRTGPTNQVQPSVSHIPPGSPAL